MVLIWASTVNVTPFLVLLSSILLVLLIEKGDGSLGTTENGKTTAKSVTTEKASKTTTRNPMHNIVDDSDEDEDHDWNKTLSDFKVIPDVINSGVPFNLKILFEEEFVKYGNILVPFRVKEEPMFVGWPSNYNDYYTILMTDPDNPDPEEPVHREWIHWMLINLKDANQSEAERIVPYQQPQQNEFRKLKGMHRYVFTVYEQPEGKIKVQEKYKDEPPYADRAHFSSKWFMKKYKLKPPCAANFFRINWL